MSNIILDAFYSLGRRINKAGGDTSSETEQGIVSEKFPELKLEMENKDLLVLTDKWLKNWDSSTVKQDWLKKCDENEKYWLGKQFVGPSAGKDRPMVDNAIFESIETYLPQVTRRNPEPMVTISSKEPNGAEQGTEEGIEAREQYASALQKDLAELADELKLRLKLKKAGRHWLIYLIGVAKLGWDMNRDIPTVKIVRGKKLILDPDCTVDEDGYTGEYVGEYRKLQASVLLKILNNIGAEEDAEKTINEMVKENKGTEVQFIEWWTAEYLCWTLGEHVLLKKKNPHWNYEKQVEAQADATTGKVPLDESGKPVMTTEPGNTNHFSVPEIPFVFLSVFNLGKQPVDDTGLVTQNLSNQDKINKRNKQIDKNADSMNNGMVVSLERAGLTQQQAKGVSEALRRGGTVAIPSGSVQDAIARMSSPSLPADVYNDLADTRNRLRDIFGTRGSTPAGIGNEKTVRGKYQVQQLDTDRIGGGVSEYLEQFADKLYNWFVQLLYVYDEAYSIKPDKPKVNVSVKEGSLLPKDSMTIANQAIELAATGKMSLLDLYKKLDFANPEELAANVWLEVNAPDMLYGKDPRIAQVIEQKQQEAQGAATEPEKLPSQSISFKDLPPDGQAQMAAKVGINLHPEALAAHALFNKEKEAEMIPKKPEIDNQNI